MEIEYFKLQSVVQSTIFCELHGCAKVKFDPYALKLKQLHQSRAVVKIKRRQKKQIEEEEMEKGVNVAHPNNYHQVVTKLSEKRSITPHLQFGSGPTNAIDLIDGKIVYRLQKQAYGFFNLEPYLLKSIKKIFSMNGSWGQNQFGKYDVAYLSDNFPTNSFNANTEKKYCYRATLFLIPPKEKVLYLYSLVSGELLRKVSLGSYFYNDVICQENGKVQLQAKKCSLPPDVEQDYLLFSYPPLNLDGHIQIKKDALKKYRMKSLELWDDYIVGKCNGNFILLFDMEKELEQAKIDPTSVQVEDEAIILTHIIQEFKTIPLFNVHSMDEFLAFSANHASHYIIKTAKECFELRQFTENGKSPIVPLDEEQKLHLPSTSLDPDTPVTFLRNFGPRVMINHGATIRIFGIKDTSATEKKFELLFNKNFVHSSTAFKDTPPPPLMPSSRFGLRDRKARISYESDQDLQLENAENETLMQLAIIRFSPGSIECSIFDSFHYNLLYCLNPTAFSPKKDDIYNQIFVFFYDDCIAVKEHGMGGRERKIYTFNLLRGLE